MAWSIEGKGIKHSLVRDAPRSLSTESRRCGLDLFLVYTGPFSVSLLLDNSVTKSLTLKQWKPWLVSAGPELVLRFGERATPASPPTEIPRLPRRIRSSFSVAIRS